MIPGPMRPKTKMPVGNWSIPSLLDWSVLPARVMATAWLDPEYRRALLASPSAVLRKASRSWPQDRTFVVLADTDDLRHFVLPSLRGSQRSLGASELKAVVEREVGADATFKYGWLPAATIFKALTDSEFKRELFRSPKCAMEEQGLDVPGGSEIVIVENAEYTYHLVLPICPRNWASLSFDAIHESLLLDFGAGTTR